MNRRLRSGRISASRRKREGIIRRIAYLGHDPRGDRHLVSIQLNLILPEMTVSPQIVLCYGCAVDEKGKGIMPGEEVTLKMPAGGFYGWVKTQIAKEMTLSRVSKAQIDVIYVTLPGGNKWFSGGMKTADPKNPCPSEAAP